MRNTNHEDIHVQFSPSFSCHFLPIRNNNLPQCSILEQHQPIFLCQCERPSFTPTSKTGKITIQINHQPDATIFQFIILTFIYSSTGFGRFPTHHQELNDCSGSLWFYLRIVVTVVLCSWSGRPAETWWAVNKRQDNKLKNCCIWLVIYLNCTIMHGLKKP